MQTSFTTGWPSRASRAPVLVTAVLSAVIATGFVRVWSHEQTAGAWSTPPDVWPATSALPVEAGQPRIVLFAHPRCPCFRASLAELERILAARGDAATAVVVFYRPKSLPESWVEGATWQAAHRISGVRVFRDDDGVEAQRFGAVTSGMAVAYGSDGRLQFAGGITPSRGHEGRNDGAQFLMTPPERGGSSARTCSVYGCPLFPQATRPADRPE